MKLLKFFLGERKEREEEESEFFFRRRASKVLDLDPEKKKG